MTKENLPLIKIEVGETEPQDLSLLTHGCLFARKKALQWLIESGLADDRTREELEAVENAIKFNYFNDPVAAKERAQFDLERAWEKGDEVRAKKAKARLAAAGEHLPTKNQVIELLTAAK